MSNLTRTFRLWIYGALFCAVGAVLGLASHFGQLFLPHIHHDFTIFSIAVPSITIIIFILLLLRSQPRVEAVFLFIMSVLWLTMASYSTDVIGHVECYPLAGQTTPTKNGTMSLQQYCYEMKAIEALSWAIFAVLVLTFCILLALATRSQALGRAYIWRESISDLPWFGQWNQPYMGYAPAQPMYQGGYAPGIGGYMVQQQPGHSIIISGNGQGQASINQVPGTVIAA